MNPKMEGNAFVEIVALILQAQAQKPNALGALVYPIFAARNVVFDTAHQVFGDAP